MSAFTPLAPGCLGAAQALPIDLCTQLVAAIQPPAPSLHSGRQPVERLLRWDGVIDLVPSNRNFVKSLKLNRHPDEMSPGLTVEQASSHLSNHVILPLMP